MCAFGTQERQKGRVHAPGPFDAAGKNRDLGKESMEGEAEGKIGHALADEKNAYDQTDGDGGDEGMEQRNSAQHKGYNG